MSKVKDGVNGLCAAGAMATPGNVIKAVEMTLSVAQSIGQCGEIDPEDMQRKLQNWEQSSDVAIRGDGAAPAAIRMFPVAVHLYLKYGENLLLCKGALDEIVKAVAITHTDVESIVGSILYCGILGRLLAGKELREAVGTCVHMLWHYYHDREEYGTVSQILDHVDDGHDIHLQWFQLDDSGTFRTTMDWATFLLFRSDSYSWCVQQAVNAPVKEPGILTAAVGTVAGLIYGEEAIPEEWLAKIVSRERVDLCCDLLEKYWNKTVQGRGIGYACREERWL